MQIHELNNFNGTPGSTNYLAIDNGSDTARISGTDLLAPVNARIDNVVLQNKSESVNLFAGNISKGGGTYTLSESAANFDFLEFIFYFNAQTVATTRVRPNADILVSVPGFDATLSVPGLDVTRLAVSISGTSFRVTQAYNWNWNGVEDTNASVTPSWAWADQLSIEVYGIRYAQLDSTEVTDLRTAHNGTVYQTARAAREADYDALDDRINENETAVINMEDNFPIYPLNTAFFDGLNYGVPGNVEFTHLWTDENGKIGAALDSTNSLIFKVKPNTTYYVYIPYQNRGFAAATSEDSFVVGQTYTPITINTLPYQYQGSYVRKFTTGAGVKKIILFFYSGSYNYQSHKNEIIINESDFTPNALPTISSKYIPPYILPEIEPKDTSFFEGANYFDPNTATLYTDRYVDVNGTISSSAGVNTLVMPVRGNTVYYLYIPNTNRGVVAESDDNDFSVGSVKTPLITDSPTLPWKFTTGVTAKYICVYFYSGTYNYESNKSNIVLNKNKYFGKVTPYIAEEYINNSALPIIQPSGTSFFDGLNYFDPAKASLFTDRFVDIDGVIKSGTNLTTLAFPAQPNTSYYLYIPGHNRGIVAESSNDNFSVGEEKTILINTNPLAPWHFTTGATAKYIVTYFYSGTYDYERYKNHIVLNIGQYYGEITPFIPAKYLASDISNPLDNTQVLIFGDSITDTCNFTINSSKETTAYTWRNPSNSYVNAQGVTIQYSMWPKILKDSQPCEEIRNYARSGAGYLTHERPAGEERQNVHYQIDVALNDLDNPHGVFSVNDFQPDIVIFALGTNDGVPNDTYETAMAATVYQSDGVSIDVDATINALDETKFCQSARKAFMRVKRAFPTAQIYCVMPIQRANNDTNLGTLHEYLKKIAERYGCIIIDGTFTSGITRDFNEWNALGTYLKDGLHPNEKGQNLMARMIIGSIKNNFMPFGIGFNS